MIETRGWGPNTEHFQRRRSYQRLSVLPWAYEDSYFLYRGNKENVATATDNLVLRKTGNRFVPTGQYTTEPLKPPPGCRFTRLDYTARTPADTTLSAKILNAAGQPLHADARPGMRLNISEPVRLVFEFHSADGKQTPVLDDYSLAFDRTAK